MRYPERCLRNRTDCQPLAQIEADSGESFVCCGDRLGDPTMWAVPQDRFTHCLKTQDGVDQMQHMDRYDLDSKLYVLSRALVMDDLREAAAREAIGGDDERQG